VSHGRLIDHFTRRARRLFPGWSADLVAVSVSLIDREDAKTIGMDMTPPALEAGRRGYST